MIEARYVGRHGQWRELYVAVVDELTVPDVSKLPRPYVLLVAFDVGDVDPAAAARFADEFLAVGGCVYESARGAKSAAGCMTCSTRLSFAPFPRTAGTKSS